MSEDGLNKTCGHCENYMFYTAISESEGFCKATRGTKVGDLGKKVRFDTDASECSNFIELTHVYTDSSQSIGTNPHLRVYKGYGDVRSDPLVFEKHEKEKEGK